MANVAAVKLALISVLLLSLLLPADCRGGRGGGGRGGGRGFGRGRGRGRFRGVRGPIVNKGPAASTSSNKGPKMTGWGLIAILLFVIALLSGLYFGAWYVCNVMGNSNKGHYILDETEEEAFTKQKLYSGLDMVDEAKDPYMKQTLDLDRVNENLSVENEVTTPSAPDTHNASP